MHFISGGQFVGRQAHKRARLSYVPAPAMILYGRMDGGSLPVRLEIVAVGIINNFIWYFSS